MQAEHSVWFGEPTERITNGSYRPILFDDCCGTTHRKRNPFAIHSRSSSHSLADRKSEHSLPTVHGPLTFYSLLKYFILIVLMMVFSFLPFGLYNEEFQFFPSSRDNKCY